jgi:hypothetical protein
MSDIPDTLITFKENIMDNIAAMYAEFISWYDPYYMDDQPENVNDMIYNLKEIKKDLLQAGTDFPEVQEGLAKIDNILQLA